MKVREIMTRNVVCVSLNSTAAEAAKKMKESNVGTVMVIEEDKVKGLITDRAIVTKVIAESRDPNTVKVADIMSKDLITCKEENDIIDVIKTIGENRIRRIPVINERQELVGVVSIADLATEMKSCIDSILNEEAKAAR
jgi:CBS domain-containing protein